MRLLNKKRFITCAILVCALLVNVMPVHAKSGRATYYRGSALMWTRDNVDFNYKNNKISSSSGYQENGWIFPNIARNKGISRTSKSSKQHKYRAINVIGAGVPTPWGDVKVYESTFTHVLKVYSDGSWTAYSN